MYRYTFFSCSYVRCYLSVLNMQPSSSLQAQYCNSGPSGGHIQCLQNLDLSNNTVQPQILPVPSTRTDGTRPSIAPAAAAALLAAAVIAARNRLNERQQCLPNTDKKPIKDRSFEIQQTQRQTNIKLTFPHKPDHRKESAHKNPTLHGRVSIDDNSEEENGYDQQRNGKASQLLDTENIFTDLLITSLLNLTGGQAIQGK